MSLLTTYRSFRRTGDGTSIEMVEETLPQKLQPSEVLIKIHAVSLNYRDVAMLKGKYPHKVIDRGVSCSDAAATVVSIGSSVTMWREGDYVAPSFHLSWLSRQRNPTIAQSTGGDVDGLLREYAIFDEKVLTRLPAHMSHEEASTICCAGTTAWSALDFHVKNKPKPRFVLAEGTGGVSIYTAILCVAAGITPLITSSSNEKLTKIKAIGTQDHPVLGINYRTHSEVGQEARRLTDGKGVDVVVNNVGVSSIHQSFESLCAFGGVISLVGFLGGFDKGQNSLDLILQITKKKAKLQYVTTCIYLLSTC